MLAVKLGFRVFLTNRRRSALSALVVAGGSALALVLWAIAQDVETQLLNRTLLQSSGHVQVVREGYDLTPEVSKDLGSFNPPKGPEVVAWSARTEAWGIAFGRRSSAGALLLGVEPSETLVTLLPLPGKGVLVGKKLARRLGVKPGDTLVFLTQDARGSMAPDLFLVSGIYAGSEDLEEFGVITQAQRVRELVLAGPHRLVIRLKDPTKASSFARSYNPGKGLKAIPWEESLPVLKAALDVSAQFVDIVLLAFVVLAAGSVMLASLASYDQRLREFGLMRALGAPGQLIAGSVLTEGALISAAGIFLGTLAGLGLTLILGKVGIDLSFAEEVLKRMSYPSVIRPRVGPEALRGFAGSALVLFFSGLFGALYPAVRALRVRPSEVLRR